MKKISNLILTFLLLISLGSASLWAGNYCVGVRGNGELALAHWVSLARIVENKGLPEAIAGGSSAAISLFFLDALSYNKNLSQDEV